MTSAEINTKTQMAVAYYDAQNVATLRKAAQGKIKNVKGMRKVDLVRALAEYDVRQAELDAADKALDETIAAQEAAYSETDPKPANPTKEQLRKDGKENRDAFREAVVDNETKSKPKPKQRTRAGDGSATRKGYCQSCGKRRAASRRVNNGIDGLCVPCYEYAGWENTHSDNGHNMVIPGTESADLRAEMDECPVCQNADPADEPARKNGSKPGRKVAPQPERKPGQTKGQKFASDAKANGWRAKIETGENGRLEIVVVTHPNTGEWLRIQWRDGACLNTGTVHKGQDGKERKVRNASAARKVLESA